MHEQSAAHSFSIKCIVPFNTALPNSASLNSLFNIQLFSELLVALNASQWSLASRNQRMPMVAHQSHSTQANGHSPVALKARQWSLASSNQCMPMVTRQCEVVNVCTVYNGERLDTQHRRCSEQSAAHSFISFSMYSALQRTAPHVLHCC